MKIARTLLLGVLLATTGGVGLAQSNSYPSRPVEMIVPWPAGGGTDTVARVFAEAARATLPQAILVINKPGAIGSIGFSEAAEAKPDGYKVVMATPELLIAPYLRIGRANYQAFIPIARLNADPSAITVKADAPWKTIEEFLAHARKNNGQVTLSTTGNGAVPDIAALALEDKTAIKFVRVPYQGEAPAIQAALAGEVDATVAAPGALGQHVAANKLRILAVTSAERISQFSNVPTLKERGVDVAIGTWRGLMMPIGTPPEIVKQWRELCQKVSADPKYQEALKKQNINLIYEDGDAFSAVLHKENDLYKRLVPRLQITAK